MNFSGSKFRMFHVEQVSILLTGKIIFVNILIELSVIGSSFFLRLAAVTLDRVGMI